jgi:hypothetical protein
MTPPKTSSRLKRSTTHKKSSRRFDLIERKQSGRRLVEFPQVQGRVVDTIQFETASDFHGITIDFKDRTSLSVIIEPSFCSTPTFPTSAPETARPQTLASYAEHYE